MTTKQEIAKIRKELQATERAIALQDRPKSRVSKNLTPVGLPDNKNPETNTGDVPGYIALPKRMRKKPENKW